MIEAVIFDMDGTLIDSERLWQQAEISGFSSVGLALTLEDVMQTTGIRLDQVVDYWFDRRPWQGATTDDVIQIIVENVKALIRDQGEATEGAIEAIQFFADRKLPLAIASASFQTIIETTMEKLQIGNYFDVIHSAEFEKFGKPDPAVYLTTARKLGVKPENCLVFEDTIPGITAAKAANMTCVAMKEHSTPFEQAQAIADFSLESFSNLQRASWLGTLI